MERLATVASSASSASSASTRTNRRLASRGVRCPPYPTREHPTRDASGPAEHTQALGRRKLKSPRREFPVRPRRRMHSFCMRISDPQTDVAPGSTRGRNVRSKNQCSMCPAIHTKSRSWLRSSSTREPSDPLLRVVFQFMRLPGSPPSAKCVRKVRSRCLSPPLGGEKRSRLERKSRPRTLCRERAETSKLGPGPRES